MDFFNGPDFPFYLKLSWYPWPIISLGGSVFGGGGEQYKEKDTLGVLLL